MTTEAHWTIDELAQLVGEALAVDYSGQSNGRVREVPDRRTIRWYTTIGLLDRPAAMRGRTALYDRRHLMQLVAVKRLQADGRSIAQVQEALLGADDRTLTSLARLPEPAAPEPAARAIDTAPARFWAAHPARPTPPRAALVPSLRLADGVTLVLDGAPRQLDAADLVAIADAATALLNVLHDRGLATPTDAAPTEGGQA
ncbi:MAG TPA: MerR family transcriptional regulator [Pseudonocardiaceae bacterium]|jgi:DNA-binding transcriptional MerR regulator|nr:MerR family transcriptional regulator [Pseudonocardiaceae bacterium]